jgi:adenylate cyclase
MAAHGGPATEKRRHLLPAESDLTIEVDVLCRDLDGLVLAEIEFPSEDAARNFEAPDWLGADGSGDARFSNQKLATGGAPSRTA